MFVSFNEIFYWIACWAHRFRSGIQQVTCQKVWNFLWHTPLSLHLLLPLFPASPWNLTDCNYLIFSVSVGKLFLQHSREITTEFSHEQLLGIGYLGDTGQTPQCVRGYTPYLARLIVYTLGQRDLYPWRCLELYSFPTWQQCQVQEHRTPQMQTWELRSLMIKRNQGLLNCPTGSTRDRNHPGPDLRAEEFPVVVVPLPVMVVLSARSHCSFDQQSGHEAFISYRRERVFPPFYPSADLQALTLPCQSNLSRVCLSGGCPP